MEKSTSVFMSISVDTILRRIILIFVKDFDHNFGWVSFWCSILDKNM